MLSGLVSVVYAVLNEVFRGAGKDMVFILAACSIHNEILLSGSVVRK